MFEITLICLKEYGNKLMKLCNCDWEMGVTVEGGPPSVFQTGTNVHNLA
jgi:hypothetical protein